MGNKTTIILGAGASCEYGYPLGDDLVRGIVNYLTKDRSTAAQAALKDLYAIPVESIDFF